MRLHHVQHSLRVALYLPCRVTIVLRRLPHQAVRIELDGFFIPRVTRIKFLSAGELTCRLPLSLRGVLLRGEAFVNHRLHLYRLTTFGTRFPTSAVFSLLSIEFTPVALLLLQLLAAGRVVGGRGVIAFGILLFVSVRLHF